MGRIPGAGRSIGASDSDYERAGSAQIALSAAEVFRGGHPDRQGQGAPAGWGRLKPTPRAVPPPTFTLADPEPGRRAPLASGALPPSPTRTVTAPGGRLPCSPRCPELLDAPRHHAGASALESPAAVAMIAAGWRARWCPAGSSSSGGLVGNNAAHRKSAWGRRDHPGKSWSCCAHLDGVWRPRSRDPHATGRHRAPGPAGRPGHRHVLIPGATAPKLVTG